MMLQQDAPKDYVIATGVQYSVRQFIDKAATELGIRLRFEGDGVNEKAIVESVTGTLAPAVKSGDVIVTIDPSYFRPAEVETLLGDPSMAKADLGWVPQITLDEMVKEMVQSDHREASRQLLLRGASFR